MTAMDDIIDGMDNHVNEMHVRTIAAMQTEIQKGNPVLTGWSRANWTPSIGAPKGKAPGWKGDVAAAASNSQIALIEIESKYNYRKGPSLYLSNRVPYVKYIDALHQRAAGFIARGIERGIRRVFK